MSGDEKYECVILNVFMSSLVISGCSVWCLIFGLDGFGFFLREYRYVSLHEP